MKRTSLGEFEEIVLLTIVIIGPQAYGVTITQEIEKHTGRQVGFNTVHTTLQRLEEKGFLRSEMGGATKERGGRRRRFFELTALGAKILKEVKEVRISMWNAVSHKMLSLLDHAK